jgi:nitrogen regulatory protein PII
MIGDDSMYALFLILNDTMLLDDVHEVFYNHGVGATTLDSVGMGKILLEHNVNIPMFSSIRRLLEGDRPYNKTIISVVKEEETLNEVIEDIQNTLGDLSKPGIGFMFVIPVLDIYGFNSKKNI